MLTAPVRLRTDHQALRRHVQHQSWMRSTCVKFISNWLPPSALLVGTVAVLVKGVYPLLNIRPTLASVSIGLLGCGGAGFCALLLVLAKTTTG